MNGTRFPSSVPLEPLPIDAYLAVIIDALRRSTGLVITAPPGAGKTTRIPRAIFDSGIAGEGEVLVLQPRRLATRLAAARVAAEMGERLGRTIGYSVRFESVGGPHTRIRFVTEGVLSRRVVQDPRLEGVSAVILDEFHERHLATDLALALLRRLQQGERPDLRLLVMSATLNAAPVAEFLRAVPVIIPEGRPFPVAIEFEERANDHPLAEKVAAAVARLLREGCDGDILVFLPGAAEIRQAAESLREIAARATLSVLPLHGDLPPSQQGTAIEACEKRKVILATNVAETSITVPGVAAVVDSGLARVALHSAWTGIPALHLAKISKASAEQRAGRAGRIRSGRVVRLYTRSDFESRPEHDVPEIKRSDLAETLLTLHGAGVRSPQEIHWYERPPQPALAAAEVLLRSLSALDAEGRLTQAGRTMLRFPVHPRLGRLILEGEKLHVADEAARVAALLSERDLRLEARAAIDPGGRRPRTGFLGKSDLLELLNRYHEAEKARFDPHRLLAFGLDPGAAARVRRGYLQLKRLISKSASRGPAGDDADEALQIAILSAFPDRVAKRRERGSRELLLASGGGARLSESSVVHEAPLMIAVDIEQRRGQIGAGAVPEARVRIASAVEPEWLAELFPGRLRQENQLCWNEGAARVDEVSRTFYDQITLEEKTRTASRSAAVSSILADAILARRMSCFRDHSRLGELRARLALIASHFPGDGFPELETAVIRSALDSICEERRSIAEVADVSIVESILARLSPHHREILRRHAPERIALSVGRSLKVHYEEGQPPWIESRLQDFFGLKSTPSLGGGKVALTIRLLAPNGRPVQITRDLQGFWKRHYPAVRRELMRRYPKHSWPEPGEV